MLLPSFTKQMHHFNLLAGEEHHYFQFTDRVHYPGRLNYSL